MNRLKLAFLVGLGIATSAGVPLVAYRTGFSRGVEAGLATGTETEDVGHGVAALLIIRHLEAGRRDEALADLDAEVDAAIAAHRLRVRAPSYYAEAPESPTELVAYLEEYRRSRPSTAASQTPNLNRLVSEYLQSRNHP